MIQINKITIAATFAGATALALILAGVLGSKPLAATRWRLKQGWAS